MTITTPQEVLEYWFSLETPGKKDDDAVKENLGPAYEQAAGGALDEWLWEPKIRLALIILLDQVPRHLYRNDARAFATDVKAQHIAFHFIQNQEDWESLIEARQKLYAVMPYLHAEDASMQHLVNPILKNLAITQPELAFVERISDFYLKTIERFGYFPHRNSMRGRPDSSEEKEFLEEEWNVHRRKILADGGIKPQ